MSQADMPKAASVMPPEVLAIVLRHLSNDSRGAFFTALRVSPLWASIGIPLIWTNVVLSSENLVAFVSAITASPKLGSHTQSLTVNDLHSSEESSNKHSGVLDETVSQALSHSLTAMPNLKVLSLSTSSTCCKITPHALDTVIASLPEGLTSLELSVFHWRDTDQVHSPALLRTLPRLHHFRSIGTVACYHLFSELTTPCPDLRSVVINESRRLFGHSCDKCLPTSWRSDLMGEQIARAGRRAYKAGYLPKITCLVVITRTERDRSVSQQRLSKQDRERTFSSLQCRDVLAKETSSYPLAQLGEGKQYWMLRYPNPEDDTDKTIEGFGQYQDLSVLVEGADAWEETVRGARFPPAFLDTLQARSNEYMWSDRQLLAPSELVPAIKRVTRSKLWYWEKVSGRLLLHPRSHWGLESGPMLMREICDEEEDSNSPREGPRATCDW